MIGFIGAGSMGGAIIRGALAHGFVDAADVVLCTSTPEASEARAAELGVRAAHDASALVEAVGAGGIVVVGVKPYAVPDILTSIRVAAARTQCVVVSIAAGTAIEDLAVRLDPGQAIVRVMPNVAAAIGQSMSALCPGADVTTKQAEEVARLFQSVGQVVTIAEKDFPSFSALAGCSPAYTFTYIDALARAGVRNGLRKDVAVRIAAQAVAGAAQMVLADGAPSPMTLADSVQSPGGTTVAGIVALEQAGFGAAIVAGAQASIDRDGELQH